MKHYSKQRDTILKVICGTDVHPDANYVYKMTKDQIPDISLGTVYRNLNNLKSSGDIISLGEIDGFEHYDGRTEKHVHFYCRQCKKIYDVFLSVEQLEKEVEKTLDSTVYSSNLNFEGVCGNCMSN